jgi:hypothetical protein
VGGGRVRARRAAAAGARPAQRHRPLPGAGPRLLRIRQYRLVNAASLLFATAFYGLLLANIVFLQPCGTTRC